MNYNRYTYAEYDVRGKIGRKGKDMMGYGSKTNFVSKNVVPSPNSYNILSEFDKIGLKAKKKGIMFRLGRRVIFDFVKIDLFYRK